MRGACSLATGEPATGLHVRSCPSLVPLVGKGRAPSQQYDGVIHAYARGGGDSMVAGVLTMRQCNLLPRL